MELNSVILTIGSSVGFFKLVNYGIGKLPIAETAQRNVWKWKNISTSFVHSLITGVWSVLWWVPEFPHMCMGNTHPYTPVCTVCLMPLSDVWEFYPRVRSFRLATSVCLTDVVKQTPFDRLHIDDTCGSHHLIIWTLFITTWHHKFGALSFKRHALIIIRLSL